MARRSRVAVVIAEQTLGEHSIAGLKAREDERIATEIADTMPLRASAPMRTDEDMGAKIPIALPPSHTRGGKRGPRAPDAPVWASVEDAVRAGCCSGGPDARGRGLGGELGRAYERRALGTPGATSTRSFEPWMSDALFVAWRVACRTLTEPEQALLVVMHASLAGGEDGGAKAVAAAIRSLRETSLEEATARLPWFARGLSLDLARAPRLAAIRLGRTTLARAGQDEDEVAAVATEAAEARRKLRDALLLVDLDTSGESLQGDPKRLGARRPLIPRPSLRALERRELVRACDGVVRLTEAGVREPCIAIDVFEDVRSWARCDVCGRPKR